MAMGKRALVVAGVLGVNAWRSAQSDESDRVRAIAVLPFMNLSSDVENEYFSDGLTEQLTDILAQVDGLRVVDASIFPQVPCANTNFPVLMTAEKMADTILAGA